MTNFADVNRRVTLLLIMTVFRRKIYDRMLQWKRERVGKTALLVQGARRIGKSTVVEQFAKQEYESHIIIDFSKAPSEVFDLFKDISDLDYLFLRLQLIYHIQLIKRKSVIVFDEVQQQPLARQAIKHLVKDGRYDYIETGSLISVKASSVNIVLPSEETRIDMFPMDYEEFRWALGDTATIPLLQKAFDSKMPLGDIAHRQMMRDFRLYMLIGGMPQAVDEYLNTNNFAAVDRVKRDILNLYEDDLRKIDRSGRLSALYDAIPAQLAHNRMRYKVSDVFSGRKETVSDAIETISDSMVANVAFNTSDPNVGMAQSKDTNRFKMFACDTGLFVSLAFKDRDFVDNNIYEKLLRDKLHTNLGYVYENVVAQTLRISGHQLYYHVMPKDDGKKYYEVDFLIADGHKISPIEVKSSGYIAHASLDAFADKYSSRIARKYLVYTKDYRQDSDTECIPVYMTQFL